MQTPGSPGWEAQDAANLIAAGQALAAAQKIVTAAQEREQVEVATGHADDMQDVWDLADALYAIQCALGIVARVAFQEEAEGATKAGKVLSGKSKGAITSAISALKNLLAAAGEDVTDGEDAAAKAQENFLAMTKDELIALLDERDAAKAETRKAKKAAKAGKSADAVAAEAERRAAMSPEELEAEDAAKAAEAEQEEAAKAEQVQATDAAVAEKVEAAIKGVTEQVDAVKAELEAVKKMAAPGGPVKTRTPAALVKSEQRDALEIELAELDRKMSGEVDLQVIKGYMDRAEAVRVKLASLAG
jgi:ATP-dependent Lon protease